MSKLVIVPSCVLALSFHALGFGQAPSIREACAGDVAKFCSDSQDPQSRRQCMSAHRAELSPGCLAAARQANRNSQGTDVGTEGPKPNASLQPTADSTPLPAAPAVPDAGLDSIAHRIANHSFPSVFQPWVGPRMLYKTDGSSQNLAAIETPLATLARHDLIWISWSQLGLKPTAGHEYPLLGPEFTPESIEVAKRRRATLLAANPNLILLVDAHYQSAKEDVLPPDSPYWIRNTDWERQVGYKFQAHRLNFDDPKFQDIVAAYCGAMVKTGLFDGCMLDWWNDSDDSSARLALIRKVRTAVGEKAIILGNVNQREPKLTAPYLNGVFREGFGANFFPDWRMAAADLIWDESHLRKPVLTALEGYSLAGHEDNQVMRQVTTLSLVFSNGSALFVRPNPQPPPQQLNNWYSFWDKSLGKAVGPPATLDRPNLSGAYARDYEHGEVVFNPPSNHRKVIVSFPGPRRSAATNVVANAFDVAPGDGDLFLTLGPISK